MRKLLLLLACIAVSNSAFPQSLDDFFYDKGTAHVLQAAHPANHYMSGSHDVYTGYVDVSLESKDNVFGTTIHTDVRVVRGTGDLYFSDLVVQSDDDMVRPFEAFGLQATIMVQLMKAIDQETYNKMRASIMQEFNTDFEHWTGKMWALLAMNLDYYEYMLKGK